MARQPKRSGGANAVARRPEIRVGGRWRLRNWRLRTKLIVVLLIPTITVLSLVGLQVRQDLGQAEGLAQLAARGRVDDKVNAVVQELQRERDLTVVYVAQGRKGDLSQLRDQRDRVDAAIGDFSKELDADRDLLSRDGASELEATMSRLNVLTGLRYSGETSNLPAAQVLSSYSDLISGILDLSDEAVADITDPELTRLRLATNALARVKDQMSIKRALLGDALEQREMSGDVLRSLLGADAELSAALSDYRKFATPDQQREYDATVTGAPVEQGNNIFESAVTRGENGQSLSIPDARQWDTDATDTIDLAYRVQQSLQTLTQQECDTLAAGARRAAIENAGIVLGVLVLCVVLAVIITRSLLRPLRLLRRTALEVAERRLPAAVEDILADPNPDIVARRTVAPVPVFTREEFGQVARAFDVVHSEAVRLAGDQALLRENINAMFVNLSRRSQDLVERQLSVLDRMEAGEQDPDTLGGLFELDHLATRMRRNSENLLVLAGQNPGDGPAEPAAAEEIIGAALSEVEHYQRIELTPAPELAVRGEACGDLVHLISELLENATLYSPPHTTVAVVSATARDGAWEVHITDRGAGMPEPEIRRANSRLTEPPAVDVEVSRRMGLFVVATLARRHDIRASLHAADTGGLEAVVVVPASLIVPLPP
ncbi:MAG TPA: nitrate- and nitrite sensing domain-containing protein, partial [Amycolatopsis sp.]|nr:nitrate- and nitrite sensing domain-containing protein [Amycolatopsis sp.]